MPGSLIRLKNSCRVKSVLIDPYISSNSLYFPHSNFKMRPSWEVKLPFGERPSSPLSLSPQRKGREQVGEKNFYGTQP